MSSVENVNESKVSINSDGYLSFADLAERSTSIFRLSQQGDLHFWADRGNGVLTTVAGLASKMPRAQEHDGIVVAMRTINDNTNGGGRDSVKSIWAFGNTEEIDKSDVNGPARTMSYFEDLGGSGAIDMSQDPLSFSGGRIKVDREGQLRPRGMELVSFRSSDFDKRGLKFPNYKDLPPVEYEDPQTNFKVTTDLFKELRQQGYPEDGTWLKQVGDSWQPVRQPAAQ